MDFLDCLDSVSQAMNRAKDVDHIIDDVLDAVFAIFECDRIWLFHPCDPNTATIRVLAEKNRPEYPGAFSSGQEITITSGAADTIRKAFVSDCPVVFGPETENKIDDVTAQFSVLSQMMMAIYPKTGKPWMFGMHQCSSARLWTKDEQKLFKEISYRVVEGLNNRILLQDLKKSELKYRRFFSTVQNGWAYHKTITNNEGEPVDFIFLEVNKAYEELTGLCGEDIIGQPVSQIFSKTEEMPADWIKRFGNVSLTGEGISFEGYLATRKTWFSVSVSCPEPGYFITVFEDISKRKQAEMALRESEERYSLALKAANVGTWDWDIKSGSLQWSEQIEPIFGFSKGQFDGTYVAFLDCVHPEDHQYVVDSVNSALNQYKDYDIEHRIIQPDGTVRWLAEKGTVFWNENGMPVRMLGVVLDISEQKESFERFRTVLDSLDALVYVTDMQTYELLFVNKYGRDIWGDIQGKICWHTLQTDQTGPCSFCTNIRLLDRDSKPLEPYVWEFQNTVTSEWYECRDQAIRWLDGRFVRMEIASNITQRKVGDEQKEKLEEKLRQAQKMEAIGTLAGGIAHDFNNILSVIIGYVEIVKEDCAQLHGVVSDLDEVLKAGDRAKDLVRQILAFSRQSNAERIPLQPVTVIKEAVRMLRASLPTTIQINLKIETKVANILADPTQINQILMNLCTNAFHAMEETGGRIDILLKERYFGAEDLTKEPGIEAGNFVQLSISDSGPGIAPQIRDKIFDPYFTTKEAGKGTGLGLSVVHGIVKSYGGVISLESELGQGAAFHILLPAISVGVSPEMHNAGAAPTGSEHILFIDDEELLVNMNKVMLEKLGYRVTASTNSKEALQIFQEQHDQFDLIITDQTMPGLTGAELAHRVIQIRPDIPIILCTGYSSVISEEQAIKMGIKAFAYKPIRMSDLANLIRKVLDGDLLDS